MNVQKQGISLDNFEVITLLKPVPTIAPVTSVSDALARLGNDENRLMSILTAGLQEAEADKVRATAGGWMVENEEDVLVPYDKPLANTKIVNEAVLLFAKNNFGYEEAQKSNDADAKREAKAQAVAFIKSQPVILEGLKKRSLANAS